MKFDTESEASELQPITHPPGTLDFRHMDCMELMREFPDKHFDLAVVDPPYGIGVGDNKKGMGRRKGDAKARYKMGDWDDEPPQDKYFSELFRVSKHQIVWGANHFIERIPLNSSCWIVWDKIFSHEMSFASAELAWTSFASVVKIYKGLSQCFQRIHPTQKPVKLYDWIFSNYANSGIKVLDTHMGSGSIAIAAHYAGVHLTACEIDSDYFAAATKRIAKETAQTSFL